MSRSALVVPALLLAALAAFLAERWILTDRERIERLLQGASKAAEKGEWDAVRESLDEDLEGMGRDAFVARARALAAAARPVGWDLVVEDVSVDGDRATARVEVRLSPMHRRVAENTAGSVGLVRTPSGWRIRSVAPDDPRWLPRDGR